MTTVYNKFNNSCFVCVNAVNTVLQINKSKTVRKLPQWDNSPEWSSATNDSFHLPDSHWINHMIGTCMLQFFSAYSVNLIWNK